MTSPRVATVAGRPITLERLERRVAELRRGPGARHLPPEAGAESVRLRRWLVQELVAGEVLTHEARCLGLLDGQDETARGMPASVVARLFRLVTADVTVSDAEMRAYYRRNRDRYRRPERRHILHALLTDDTAGDLAALAMRADPAAIPAGFGPWTLRRGEFSGPFEDAVFRAAVGKVVGPIRSELGWHVCRLESVIHARVAPYAEARAPIEAELRAAAQAQAFGRWLDRERQRWAVIEPAYEHPDHPIHGMPRHRH